MYNNLVAVMLNKLQSYEIIVVETVGIGPESVKHLSEFSARLLQENPEKMIVIVQPDFIGKAYPFFQIERVTQWHLENHYTWIESVGVNTGETACLTFSTWSSFFSIS